jgi:hypothetical protein
VEKELILVSQPRYTPFVALARDLLTRYKIPFREIDIQAEPAIAERLIGWVGQLSVPTLIVVATESDVPLFPPTPLDPGQSARGVDRGSLISEPNNQQLEDWLYKHGFLAKPYKR